VREQEIEGKNRELERGRQAMEAKIAVLRAEFEIEQAETVKTIEQAQSRVGLLDSGRLQMAQRRQADDATAKKASHRP
jgi:circadian clock protein KaiC